MIKELAQQEVTTFTNIYATNIRSPKYIKQTLLDIMGEIASNAIIVRDFNTLFILMNKSLHQKINKETSALNDILSQMDLIGCIQNVPSKNNG